MYDLLMSDIKQAMRYELQAISCKAEKKHLPTFHFFTVTFHDSRLTIHVIIPFSNSLPDWPALL